MTRSARDGAAAAAAAAAVVAIAVLFVAALAVVAATGAASADPAPFASTAAVEHGGAVDPTLSVPEATNRTRNMTATVSLPERANESRTFDVRVVAVAGQAVANRSVTLAPGETATVDLGACHPAQSYVVRLATADGDVLLAAQTEVEQANPLVALAEDPRETFAETVSRNETLRVDARLHQCVDRAAFSLRPSGDDESGPIWRATAFDRDDDGRVALTWDVDAASSPALVADTGTDLAAVAVDGPAPYGEYELATTTADGETGRSGRVTVSFANPTVDVYTADGALDGPGAIAAARDGDPVEAEYTVRVADGEWVVLRFDTDGTLDSLPDSASLVAPARHENVTVRVQGTYGTMEPDGPTVDLANATRRFDPASGVLWYAYRASAGNERTRFEYAAVGADWNATATTEVSGLVPVSMDVENGDLLAPERVVLEGDTPYPDGTTINVSVRANGRVLASDRVAVENRQFDARLDLSGVANGTNASVVVRTDGRVVHQRAVVVAARPALELDGFGTPRDVVAGERATVEVYVANRGTTTGNATVRVTLGNVTRSRTLQVAAGDRANLEFEFPPEALPPEGNVGIEVSAAGTTDARMEPVVRTTTPTPPTSTTRTPTTGTSGTEPWPTLVGSERGTDADTVPGFGAFTAVAALAATAATLLARTR